MRGHLKAYKDHAVVVGRILFPLGLNVPAGADRRYANFLCNEGGTFDEDNFEAISRFTCKFSEINLSRSRTFTLIS